MTEFQEIGIFKPRTVFLTKEFSSPSDKLSEMIDHKGSVTTRAKTKTWLPLMKSSWYKCTHPTGFLNIEPPTELWRSGAVPALLFFDRGYVLYDLRHYVFTALNFGCPSEWNHRRITMPDMNDFTIQTVAYIQNLVKKESISVKNIPWNFKFVCVLNRNNKTSPDHTCYVRLYLCAEGHESSISWFSTCLSSASILERNNIP